jgi:hypothetical protein
MRGSRPDERVDVLDGWSSIVSHRG